MDKYEFNVTVDQIRRAVRHRDIETAVQFADKIDWRKVKDSSALTAAADAYELNRQYDKAKELLLAARGKSQPGRHLAYRLALLSAKMKDFDEAMKYYRAFVTAAPRDTSRYVLQYRIARAKGEPVETLIRILEEYVNLDMEEKWMYELAKLYHLAGEKEKCVDLCDEMSLWFSHGEYVRRAMDLKRRYKPLTKQQEENYYKTDDDFETGSGDTGEDKEPERVKESESSLEHDSTKREEIPAPPKKTRQATLPFTVLKSEAVEKPRQDEPAENETAPDADMPVRGEIDIEDIHVKPLEKDGLDTMDVQDEIARDVKKLMDSDKGELEPLPEEPSQKISATLDPLYKYEAGGQIGLDVEKPAKEEKQITGQMSIEEVLRNLEARGILKPETVKQAVETMNEAKEAADQASEEAKEKARQQKAAETVVESLDVDDLPVDESRKAESVEDTEEGFVFTEDESRTQESPEAAEEKDTEFGEKVQEREPVADETENEEEHVSKEIANEAEPISSKPAKEPAADEAANGTNPETEPSADETGNGTNPEAKPGAESAVEGDGEKQKTETAAKEESKAAVPEAEPSADETKKEPDGSAKSAQDSESAEKETALPEAESAAEETKKEPEGEAADEDAVATADTIEFRRGVKEQDKKTPDSLREQTVELSDDIPVLDLSFDVPVKKIRPGIAPASRPKRADTESLKELFADLDAAAKQELDIADDSGKNSANESGGATEASAGDKTRRRDAAPEATAEDKEHEYSASSEATAEFKGRGEDAASAKSANDKAKKDESVSDGLIKDEAAKAESVKNDSAEDESVRDKAVKGKAAEDKSSKGESAVDETLKGEAAEDESSKDETAEEGSSKGESAVDEPSKSDAAEDDTLKGESAEDGSSKDEPVKDAAVTEQTDDSKVKDGAASEQQEPDKPSVTVSTNTNLNQTASINPDKLVVTDEEMKPFDSFKSVNGLEQAIKDTVVDLTVSYTASGDSETGNIMILGDDKSGKTTLAVELIKLINRKRERAGRRIAKVDSSVLNTRGIRSSMKKLIGSDLIVENAQRLRKNVLSEFVDVGKYYTGDMLMVFEGETSALKTLRADNLEIADMFDHVLVIKEYDVKEWVAYAKKYSASKKYMIDEMGTLALYKTIDDFYGKHQSIEQSDVETIVNRAINKAGKKVTRKITNLLSGKNDDNGFDILKESDFK